MDEIEELADLEDLEKELSSLPSTHDPLANAKLEGGTRLQSREPEGMQIPSWVWVAAAVGVVVLLGVIAVVAF